MSTIKYFFKKLPTDAAALEKLADELSVSQFDTWVTKHERAGLDTYEIQKRIREALSYTKGSWFWLLALASALASVFSALAAWMAVCSR